MNMLFDLLNKSGLEKICKIASKVVTVIIEDGEVRSPPQQ